MNVTEVTTAAGWIAGLAIVALIATGWRKPARATADPARARRPQLANPGVEVDELATPIGAPTHWYRRLWALVASTALMFWVAVALATVIGFGGAWLVITLTRMLKR
ncbi:MAG: hypothetical protein WCI22_14305 [Actinomycetota bacterium]